MKSINKKLNEIRSSDNDVKQMWFIGISVVVMTVVILLWTVYLSASVPLLSGPERSVADTQINDDSGFFQAVASGSASAFDSVRNGFLGIIESIRSPKEMEINIP